MTDIQTGREPFAEALIKDVKWEPRKVSASITIGGEEHNVWISANHDLYQETDFLLPVAILPAMKVGATLDLPGEISPRLLSSTGQIQDIFNMWESILKHVPVRAEARGAAGERSGGVACAFGGGIDSFHTAIRHRDVTHLIYLHLLSEDPSVKEAAARRVRRVAKDLGKTLIEVDTNLREFARDTGIKWKYYHGMWIAAATLLFQHMFDKVIIPGSTTSNYDNLRPQGTHPILDPLWSTELVDFHHDGCEVRRVEKAAQISGNDVAMGALQVCDMTKGGGNCGACEKCLRSMINLQAAGALSRCGTLPDKIDLEAVRALDLTGYSESYFARENLRALERAGTEPDLAAALTEALDSGSYIIAHSGYKEEQVEHFKKSNERVMKMNALLKKHNADIAARYSKRRYRAVDAVAETVLRIPGAKSLLRRLRR